MSLYPIEDYIPVYIYKVYREAARIIISPSGASLYRTPTIEPNVLNKILDMAKYKNSNWLYFDFEVCEP